VRAAREVVGWSRLVGLSTHNQEEIASRDGADYIGIGNVFPTPAKPGRPGLGVETAARLFAASPVPAFPIGGVNPSNVGLLAGAGIYRAAVASAISMSPDPASTSRLLRAALEAAAPKA